jgi:hypothetical protein
VSKLEIVALLLAASSCGESGFTFSATISPSSDLAVSIDGRTSFSTLLWWQNFQSYEDAGKANRIVVQAFSEAGSVFTIDTIGPGYCKDLCPTDLCQAGLLTSETVRVTASAPLQVSGTCIDFDGGSYDIASSSGKNPS